MVTKEEVFEYVMKSPENTNPGVLRSLLDGIEEGDKEITYAVYTKYLGSDAVLTPCIVTGKYGDIITINYSDVGFGSDTEADMLKCSMNGAEISEPIIMGRGSSKDEKITFCLSRPTSDPYNSIIIEYSSIGHMF